jgi:7-keto-8-aminopelargonate synthetase-like enzyme
MEISEFVKTVEHLHLEARQRGLYFQTCSDVEQMGRKLIMDGESRLWFGSCSYLGLESHPAVLEGAHQALSRFGTQFSTSRGYVSIPLYEELEDKLSQIFGGYALVGPTTTLAHMAAFDVLVDERDAIVMDHQVHNSVQRAATLARTRGATMEMVRHDNLEEALEKVYKLSRTKRTVWFTTDGITSMYGEVVPFDLMRKLLDVAPNVRLYIDDAHGMSWAGKHGRGSFLGSMPLTDRVVVATSMAKSFGACGGVLVFSSKEERERVRMCGGTMVFSGPIQPPTVGAALAVAKIHLTDEIDTLQTQLRDRVRYFNRRLKENGLPLLVENDVPIFFIRLGLPKVAFSVAERAAKDGLYINISIYPTVPMRRAGLRITLNTTHTFEDIEKLVASLTKHVPQALAEEGVSREELDRLFDKGVVKSTKLSNALTWKDVYTQAADGKVQTQSTTQALHAEYECDPNDLKLEVFRTIRDISKTEWNSMLGTTATCSWDSMVMKEKIFHNQPRPEHNWDFYYYLIRDTNGKAICATFLTISLGKDDMLMRHEVSKAIEDKRKTDPYFLTSKIVTLGSGLSEGNHLYLDKQGPWRAAMQRLLKEVVEVYETTQAAQLILRDLPDNDPEMDSFVVERGFIKVPMLDSHYVDVDWEDDEALVRRGPNNRARKVLRTIHDQLPNYEVKIYGSKYKDHSLSEAEVSYLHQLYLNIATKNFRINIFPIPENTITHMLDCPAWEIGVIKLKPEAGGPSDGSPVAWFAGHVVGEDYAWLVCGLDYNYVAEHGCYRQMLFQIARRAKNLGCKVIHYGMTSDVEKRRFDSRVQKNCVYVQAHNDYNATILQDYVSRVAIES